MQSRQPARQVKRGARQLPSTERPAHQLPASFGQAAFDELRMRRRTLVVAEIALPLGQQPGPDQRDQFVVDAEQRGIPMQCLVQQCEFAAAVGEIELSQDALQHPVALAEQTVPCRVLGSDCLQEDQFALHAAAMTGSPETIPWLPLPAQVALLLLGPLLTGCSAPAALPADFTALAAEMPEEQPARLWIAGTDVIAAAVATGPGGLPAIVRTTVETIAPGGRTVFAGSEWGDHGFGYRVDKVYVDGVQEATRSLLIAPDGAVLERCHSVPLPDVPQAVLATAMAIGRDVLRVEVVSDGSRETGFRCAVRDRAGRSHVVSTTMSGDLAHTTRLVNAQLQLHTR